MTAAVDASERQIAIAEAQIAQALGYTLHRCEFPPPIMLDVGYRRDRIRVFECASCGADTATPMTFTRTRNLDGSSLRHMGFPSPLLDWSRSPYVAAFFAFREPSPTGDHAIFAFLDVPNKTKLSSSSAAQITRCGPFSRGHRRHFAQQSTYTLCTTWAQTDEWRFAPHDSVVALESDEVEVAQDVVWKFTLPATQRVPVLRRLEDHNLNAASLFGSEESVVETLGSRAFLDG